MTFSLFFFLITNSALALQLSEISFKDGEADWIEISLNQTPKTTITIKDDSIISSIQPEEIMNKKFILIHFKSESANIREEGEILHLYSTKSGLTGTTEQITIENDLHIIDAVCWQNSSPPQSELEDLEKIRNSGIALDICIDSDQVKKNQSIAKINNQWQIAAHPTPGEANHHKNAPPTAIIEIQKGETNKEVPFSLNLDGSASFDPDNDALTFIWQYPDNNIFESKNPPSYRFEEAGTFEIILTVKDEFGASDNTSLIVNALAKASTSTKTGSKNTAANGDLSPDITFNEILPNPEGQDSKKEWLELYNDSNRDVNLNNWKINTKKITNKTIKANDYLIIETTLKNTENTITLYDFQDKTIDQINYTDAPEGLSFSKTTINKKNGTSASWIWDDPSKNQANPALYAIDGIVKTPPQISSDFFFEINSEGQVIKILIDETKHDFTFLQTVIKKDANISVLVAKNSQNFLLTDYQIHGSDLSDQISAKNHTKSPNTWIYYLTLPILLLCTLFFYSTFTTSPDQPSHYKSSEPHQPDTNDK